MEIFHSVGVNCKNDQFDVALVKHLLNNSFFNNKTLNTTLSLNREVRNISLTDNGLNFSSSPDGFYTSIKNFQEKVMGQKVPTGKIFPKDKTIKKLASLIDFSKNKHWEPVAAEHPNLDNPELQGIINNVSEQFFAYTGIILFITSGYRGPREQAVAMFENLYKAGSGANSPDEKKFEAAVNLVIGNYAHVWHYKKHHAPVGTPNVQATEIFDKLKEVRKKYIDQKTNLIPSNNFGAFKTKAQEEMEYIIRKEASKGRPISRHLSQKAFDCSVKNLSHYNRQVLSKMVIALGGSVPVEHGVTPHIHIQF